MHTCSVITLFFPMENFEYTETKAGTVITLLENVFIIVLCKAAVRSLEERLSAGESVICAEGYLLELARRGYISYGGFIPEVVLECSEMVKGLHYEFAHCGTDVIEAFQVC